MDYEQILYDLDGQVSCQLCPAIHLNHGAVEKLEESALQKIFFAHVDLLYSHSRNQHPSKCRTPGLNHREQHSLVQR